jgi:cytochrome c
MRRVFSSFVLSLLLAAPGMAQDAAAGANVFRRCQACHAIGEGATNRVGPALTGVFGRAAATGADYSYSQGMLDMGAAGLVWTPETLAQFLSKPRAFVLGTKMAFAGLANADDVADIIAYLASFSPPPAAPAAVTP